jgi:Homocysteine S-methyltransferase
VVPRLVHRDNVCLQGPAQSPEALAILGGRVSDLAPEQAAEESRVFITDFVGDGLETDGRLPCGDTLAGATEHTDAETAGYPAYYIINCAHPAHFDAVLRAGGGWRRRIRGLRANASKRSHAELDESTVLDSGDPEELGGCYREMHSLLPRMTVMGGCCGNDHRHVEAICCRSGQARSCRLVPWIYREPLYWVAETGALGQLVKNSGCFIAFRHWPLV